MAAPWDQTHLGPPTLPPKGEGGPESERGADWQRILGSWVPDHGGMWAPGGVLLWILRLLVLWGEMQLGEAHSGGPPVKLGPIVLRSKCGTDPNSLPKSDSKPFEDPG